MSTQTEQTATTEGSFLGTLLGKRILEDPNVRRFLALPIGLRAGIGAGVLAFLLFVPFLGAVGLWDPWETHYGEVARSMIQRRDYVHPYWESAWFFSKPPFSMWMMAVGMQLVGTNRTDGELALFTEWGMRLPFALFSLAAVVLLAMAVARVVSGRSGLAAGFVLATMPLYFLLSRQAVTDTPFLSAVVCAMACALIAQLDPGVKNRTGWWYAFYLFCAVATLAKGLMGFGVPAVVLLAYALLCVMPWKWEALNEHARWVWDHALVPLLVSVGAAGAFAFVMRGLHLEVTDYVLPAIAIQWAAFVATLHFTHKPGASMPALIAQLYRMRLGTGVLLFFAGAFPWYAKMFAFRGVDDESKLFWFRFLIHDHLSRLGAGVHTTTPGGTFTYFIEQGGYAIFPWVLLLPGAAAVVAKLKVRSDRPEDHLGVWAVLWLVINFTLIGSSATKFHHYVFPMLPPLAILLGIYLDRLWKEGLAAHSALLLAGVPLFVLVGKDLATNPKNFTDLFVYNYDRPYPQEMVAKTVNFAPFSWFSDRGVSMGDLIGLFGLFVGGFLLVNSLRKPTHAVFKALGIFLALAGGSCLLTTGMNGRISPSLFLGLSLGLALIYLVYESLRPEQPHKQLLWVVSLLGGFAALGLVGRGIQLAVVQDPLYAVLLDPASLKGEALGFFFAVGGLLAACALATQRREWAFGTFGAFALGFALWFNWSHWVDLSHHWTQRDQFWRYYRQRQPDEPITAFLMNWRGETLYSKNTVKQIKDNNLLFQYANQPGREWALVEHNRLGILKSAVGADKKVTLIDRDLNNKFVLVTIE